MSTVYQNTRSKITPVTESKMSKITKFIGRMKEHNNQLHHIYKIIVLYAVKDPKHCANLFVNFVLTERRKFIREHKVFHESLDKNAKLYMDNLSEVNDLYNEYYTNKIVPKLIAMRDTEFMKNVSMNKEFVKNYEELIREKVII
jgi:hypothetical protein